MPSHLGCNDANEDRLLADSWMELLPSGGPSWSGLSGLGSTTWGGLSAAGFSELPGIYGVQLAYLASRVEWIMSRPVAIQLFIPETLPRIFAVLMFTGSRSERWLRSSLRSTNHSACVLHDASLSQMPFQSSSVWPPGQSVLGLLASNWVVQCWTFSWFSWS